MIADVEFVINQLQLNEKRWNRYIQKQRKRKDRFERINSGNNNWDDMDIVHINNKRETDTNDGNRTDDETESNEDDKNRDTAMMDKDKQRKSSLEAGTDAVSSSDDIEGTGFGEDANWKDPKFDPDKKYEIDWNIKQTTIACCAVAAAHFKVYRKHYDLELKWDDPAMNKFCEIYTEAGIFLH